VIRKLVFIEWLDACYLGADYRFAGDLKDGDGAMMLSAGFLVKETSEGMYLAGDADPDEKDRYRHLSFVPKGMIKRKRVFKVK
jgi:hypothetical protein